MHVVWDVEDVEFFEKCEQENSTDTRYHLCRKSSVEKALDYVTGLRQKRISFTVMLKPGRVTAPGFLLRHEHTRPRQEEQPMPFQEGKSGNPAAGRAIAKGRACKAC
jgi:hypothetical protein